MKRRPVTLTVKVDPVCRAPEISVVQTDEEGGLGPEFFDVLSDNVTDPDGDDVSLVSVSTDGPGSVSIEIDRDDGSPDH